MLRGSPFFVAMVFAACAWIAPTHVCAQGSDAEARALFNAGEVAYTDGRWEAALDYFQRAFDMSQRPMLLFNIGSAAEHLRRDEVALAAFRRYLVEIPDAPNHASVASRVAVLERAVSAAHVTTTTTTSLETTATPAEPLGEPAATEAEVAAEREAMSRAWEPSPPPHVDPIPPRSSRGSDPAPWIVVGVGGGLLVAAAVLLGAGYANLGAVNNARDGVPLSEISGAHETVPVLTGVGWAGAALGIVAITAGIAWGLGQSGSSDAHVSAWGDDRGGGIVAWGEF